MSGDKASGSGVEGSLGSVRFFYVGRHTVFILNSRSLLLLPLTMTRFSTCITGHSYHGKIV